MRVALPALRRRVARAACGIAGCLALGLAARAAEPPALDAEIRALSDKVLADPGDAAAVQKLAKLRPEQAETRREALRSLEVGLEAYLSGEFAVAAQELKKAARSPEAVYLADKLLLSPVREIVADSEKRSAKSSDVCSACGGSGWADCPGSGCYSSGVTPCATCRGLGRGRKTGRPCPGCGGGGEVTCPKCLGAGLVRCPTCRGGETGGAERTWVGSNAAEAIKKVISMARYLRGGGPDLFSPGALEPSPKLRK